MSIDINVGIHNKFVVDLIDAETGKIKQTATGYNVICNGYYSSIITDSRMGIALGSGNGIPAATDKALFHQEFHTTDNISKIGTSYSKDQRVFSYTMGITLTETQLAGVTITEVGLRSNARLLTHAMLQDMNGNPVSIAKSDTDILSVYATLYLHWDESYANGKIRVMQTFEGSSYSGTENGLPYILNFTNGRLSQYTASGYPRDYTGYYYLPELIFPMGNRPISSNPVNSLSRRASREGKTLTLPFGRLPVGAGNGYSPKYIFCYLGTSSNYANVDSKADIIVDASLFGPFAIENESVGEGDGVTREYSTKHDFPQNATVYINGVPQSGVEVLSRPTARGITPTAYLFRISGDSTPENIIELDTRMALDSLLDLSNECRCKIRVRAGTTDIYYNKYGLDMSGFYTSQSYVKWSGSNDLVNWTPEVYSNPTTTYRFYKFHNVYTDDWGIEIGLAGKNKNIVFQDPPEIGDVISIKYETNCIPKDSDHVWDLTITVQLGDYLPEE